MQRILLVEDSLEVQKIVEATLSRSFAVTMVATSADAKKQLSSAAYDLILLDILLPDGDGTALCADLQNDPLTADVPVIFLTGKTDTSDKILGFSVGAEDYVTKPFAPAELRARVESRLKRIRTRKEREEVVRKGDLAFEPAFQRVSIIGAKSESRLELTPIEYKILLHLAKHEDQVLSRDQLINAVWGPGVAIVDRTVDVHVSNLRKKLSTSNCTVKSVHRMGYTFVKRGAGARASAAGNSATARS